MLKFFLFFIVLFFIVFKGFSQENFSYSLLPLAGTFITHKDLRVAKESMQYGFSAEVSKTTFGKHYWQFAHNYPLMGLHVEVKNMGNSKVYGNAFSVIPFLEFTILRSGRSSLRIKHGTGLAFVSKRYDVNTNPANRLIGSHLNATSFIGVGYEAHLSGKTDLKIGGLLNHISNGTLQLPNAGTNTFAGYVGIAYYPNRVSLMYQKYELYRDFSKWRFRVGTAVGMYGNSKINHTIEKNWQAGIMVFRQHNTRFRTGAGMEFGYLASKINKIQPTIYLEEEVQFKNLTTIYGFGTYLANKREKAETFYSKIGLAYYPFSKSKIPEGWYIGSALKAHNYKAAHIELSSGFVF